MGTKRSVWIFSCFAFGASAPAWAAEPKSALEALARLKPTSGAALVAEVQATEAACRGKLRHELRDHPGLLAEIERRLNAGALEDQKAILELERCFSAPKLRPLLEKALGIEGLTPLAAEIAGRFEDPVYVAPLLATLIGKKAECLKVTPDDPGAEACVWLVYALGPSVKKAGAGTKAEVKKELDGLDAAAHPKIKEVLAETLRSAR
jgi:hypothetical protein